MEILTDVLASETGRELIAPSVSVTMDLLGSMLHLPLTPLIGTLNALTRVLATDPLVCANVTRVTLERDAVVPPALTIAPDMEHATTSSSYLAWTPSSLSTTTLWRLTIPGTRARSRLVSAILTMRELTAPFASAHAEITS